MRTRLQLHVWHKVHIPASNMNEIVFLNDLTLLRRCSFSLSLEYCRYGRPRAGGGGERRKKDWMRGRRGERRRCKEKMMRGEGEEGRERKWGGEKEWRRRKEREGEGEGFLPCDSPGHIWCNIMETCAAVTNQLPQAGKPSPQTCSTVVERGGALSHAHHMTWPKEEWALTTFDGRVYLPSTNQSYFYHE